MTTESAPPTPSEDPTAPDEIGEAKAARDRIAALGRSEPWTLLQPLKPWALYGWGTIPTAYRRVRDHVEIIGAVCDGLRGTPVLQLPEDCRPAGVTMSPISVGGTTGDATASIRPDGLVFIETDRWSGDRTHLDFGLISFPVMTEQLAQAVAEAAARSPKRRTVPECRNGVIVQVSP